MTTETFWHPVRRLVRVFWLAIRRYNADEQSGRAVALTYYTVFSIVPVAALLFGIAKGFDLESRLRAVLVDRLWQHKELLDWVGQFADTTLKQAQGGVVAGVGVIALIWTVMWLAGNVEKAFNAVWKLPPRRGIFRKFSDYLAIVLLTPVLLVVMSSAGVFIRGTLKHAADKLPYFGAEAAVVLDLAAGALPALIACLVFTLIYFMVPNTKVRFLPALLAGIVAGLLYQAFQDGFIFLQKSIYRYNRIYGSFAALPLFLIWLQWSWQIALFGAEIGFVAQNLDTGLFGGGDGHSSERLRRSFQLTLAGLIFGKLSSGGGASTREELAARLELAPIQLDREIAVLVDAGIVMPVDCDGEPAYLPARPESFTLSDCRRELAAAGVDAADPEVTAAVAPAAEVLRRLDAAAASDPVNQPLAEFGRGRNKSVSTQNKEVKS